MPGSGVPVEPRRKGILVCDWCLSDGKLIGEGYRPMYHVKCTKCHHEWDIALSRSQYRLLRDL